MFVKEHIKGFILFGLFLILGLVIGILSALKPVDAVIAFSTHNVHIYAVIEQAGYLSFIFGSLFTLLAVIVVTSFVGRFSYSTILLALICVIMGYFQGGTVVLVIRVYGFIAIPFVVCYAVTTIAIDLILFAHFVMLSLCASERRKYGCKAPFLKVLFNSINVLLLAFAMLIAKYFLIIIFSFFL